MKKVILLAGYPATGKTYMSKVIKHQFPQAIYLAQDDIKELLYDMVGFNSELEKEELVDFSRSIFYSIIERSIIQNELLMLDYPFSYKQLEFLNELSAKLDCQFFTIRLIGNLDILYERRVERDLIPTRNKGHILQKYHGTESYNRASYPLSCRQYKKNCQDGKYADFEYGETIEIDVTNYDQINYSNILLELKSFIKKQN